GRRVAQLARIAVLAVRQRPVIRRYMDGVRWRAGAAWGPDQLPGVAVDADHGGLFLGQDQRRARRRAAAIGQCGAELTGVAVGAQADDLAHERGVRGAGPIVVEDRYRDRRAGLCRIELADGGVARFLDVLERAIRVAIDAVAQLVVARIAGDDRDRDRLALLDRVGVDQNLLDRRSDIEDRVRFVYLVTEVRSGTHLDGDLIVLVAVDVDMTGRAAVALLRRVHRHCFGREVAPVDLTAVGPARAGGQERDRQLDFRALV